MQKTTLRLFCAFAALGFVPIMNGCGGGSEQIFGLPKITLNDRVVFVRPLSSGTAGPIWISETNGQNPVRLTSQSDSQPVMNDRTIAFIRDNQLWTMNLAGSNQKQLTTGAAAFFVVDDPAWKKDGTEIIFAGRKTAADFFHIYGLRLADNSLFKYTGDGDNPDTSINPPRPPGTVGETETISKASNEFDPEYSRAGNQIVFATDRHVRRIPGIGQQKTITELYKINVSNGTASGLVRLTKHDFSAGGASGTFTSSTSTGNPVFSTDDSSILFESQDVNSLARQLYSIPTTGRALTTDNWVPFTNNAASSSSPSFSVDGKTIAWSRGNNVVISPNGPEASRSRVVTDGIQPSLGRFVSTGPTVTPQPIVTPRPSTTPSPFTRSLTAQGAITLKREANGSVSRFTNLYITGDHEADGGGAIQAFVRYSLASVPAGATINSATLDLAQTPRDGNPFGNLGPSYVELATSEALNEGALSSGARLIGATRIEAASVDITPLLQQAVNAGQTQIMLRLRFRDVKNNNDQNDNMNNSFGLIRYTTN